MKKIKLTPIDEEYDEEYDEEFDGYEDIGPEEDLHAGFDLTPYIITCVIACGVLFAIRFAAKRLPHKR